MKQLAILTTIVFAFALGFFVGKSKSKKSDVVHNSEFQDRNSRKKIVVTTKKKTSSKNKKNKKKQGQDEENSNKKKKDLSLFKLKGPQPSEMNQMFTDPKVFEEVFRKCDTGDKDACYSYHRYLRYTGQGKKLGKILKKKCFDGDYESCNDVLYNSSKQERGKLEKHLFDACQNNEAKACSIYANALESKPPSKESLMVKKKACELNEETCIGYAMYLKMTDEKDVGKYMERACLASKESSYQCYSAIHYFTSEGQIEEAIRISEIGCDRSNTSSCSQLYKMYLGTKQFDKAKDLRKERCADKENHYWGLDCHMLKEKNPPPEN